MKGSTLHHHIKRLILALVSLALFAPLIHGGGKPVQQESLAQKTGKLALEANLVNVAIAVTDARGQYVPGLAADDFAIFDDWIKQPIAHFSDADVPISIGIVFDTSGSMKNCVGQSVIALREFLKTCHEDDDFFVLGFNDRVNLVQDFTTSVDEVLKSLENAQPNGATPLFDAIYLGVEKIQNGRHARKALLIITDGIDNNSRYTNKDIVNRLREADVEVYAISIIDPLAARRAIFGNAALQKFAGLTGGRAFFPRLRKQVVDFTDICTAIALELRHKYVIGFYPTAIGSAAKPHKVNVRLTPTERHGRLALSYRSEYQSFAK